MNGSGQSDSPTVPTKFPNKAGGPAAEGMEGRGLAKGNPSQHTAPRAQDRVGALSALERVRQVAKRDKQVRFTTLLHHVYNIEHLRVAYFALKRDAVPGIDGETWQHYGQALEEHLRDLSGRLARGAYRAKPVKRAYIAKADGRPRPLGIPTLEDKLVQRTTVEVLHAIYEADFLGFSYGFRPGRSPHHALDALYAGLLTRKVNWVLDLDIRGFFDAIDRGWLVKFVEHRIADQRVVRLIQKWLNAGALEDGTRTWSETGTPQGGSISPLLANVYLHYVFDLWVQRWRRTQARGDMVVVRYADDVIVGFEHRVEAERFLAELRERLAKFSLELHPEKTRLLEFGPFAAERRRRAGLGKPETFDFLGFTHIGGKKRNGRFTVVRQTIRQRVQAKLSEVKAELRRRLHAPIPEVGRWLRSVVEGHLRYYGVPMNRPALSTFCF
jgi:group II intron reverse transcriptase/maturase